MEIDRSGKREENTKKNRINNRFVQVNIKIIEYIGKEDI